MRNFVRVRQLALLSGFALITSGMASVAVAEANLNAHLHGAYAFTAAKTCTESPEAFVGPTFAIPPLLPVGALSRNSQVNSGIVIFNGDGTGTTTGRSSTLNITSTGGSPLSISDFTSDFTYTVNADGTVDRAITTVFEIVFGSGAGFTGTVTGQVERSQISHGNTMLVSAPQFQVTPETLVVTPPGGIPFNRYRICVNSQVSTKLPSQ